MTKRLWAATAALATTAGTVWLLAAAPATPAGEVAYPEGFRAWTHISTGLIGPASPAFDHFGGMHSIYANRAALAGYRTGHFPDGSMLAFDVLTLVTDKASDSSRAGERRIVDVMEKDSRRFAATGGWGYGEFKGSSRTERSLVQAQAVTNCHACHQTQKATDSVFSHVMGAEAMPGG